MIPVYTTTSVPQETVESGWEEPVNIVEVEDDFRSSQFVGISNSAGEVDPERYFKSVYI